MLTVSIYKTLPNYIRCNKKEHFLVNVKTPKTNHHYNMSCLIMSSSRFYSQLKNWNMLNNCAVWTKLDLETQLAMNYLLIHTLAANQGLCFMFTEIVMSLK